MRVARASAWSQTLRNPPQLRPKLAAVIDDATPHARFPGARSPQRCPMPGSPRCATRGRPERPRRPADQRAVAKAGAAASLHGAQAPPSSSAGLTSTRRATRMNPRRVADSSGHPTASPGRGCSVALSVRSSELRTSRRSLAWHCYSAAGAPADAIAITRLVPRRDNRRDRDVAEVIAPSIASQAWKRSSATDGRRNRTRSQS